MFQLDHVGAVVNRRVCQMTDGNGDWEREVLVALTKLTSEMASLREEQQRTNKRLDSFESTYVHSSRFAPIEKAVYALLTLIAMTVVGAMLAQVIIP